MESIITKNPGRNKMFKYTERPSCGNAKLNFIETQISKTHDICMQIFQKKNIYIYQSWAIFLAP